MRSHPPGTNGRLVSIEGISGVGKTHLATSVLADWPAPTRPLLLEEFSRRPATGHDLGRNLLRALVAAADGDPFLRGGWPRTETLLLLAIKTFDYESSRDALASGQLVIEGRSLDTIAVYQSLILHPDDDTAAYTQARTILAQAARWRPLPDRTILITDDVAAAGGRAEARDRMRFTPGHWQIHHRAAALFDRLAANDPHRVHTLDLRRVPRGEICAALTDLITTTSPATPDDQALAAQPTPRRPRTA